MLGRVRTVSAPAAHQLPGLSSRQPLCHERLSQLRLWHHILTTVLHCLLVKERSPRKDSNRERSPTAAGHPPRKPYYTIPASLVYRFDKVILGLLSKPRRPREAWSCRLPVFGLRPGQAEDVAASPAELRTTNSM